MGFFFFYHHVRRRVRGGSYVSFSNVCPRYYLNNVQDIIKVHFSQLRLVVSFNNPRSVTGTELDGMVQEGRTGT